MDEELREIAERPGRPGHVRHSQDPHLRHYLGIVRRRIWAVGLTLIIVATLGILSAYKATPIYQATAKMLVERQVPKPGNIGSDQPSGGFFESYNYYETQKELIRGRAVLEKVAAQRETHKASADAHQRETRPSVADKLWTTTVVKLGQTISAMIGGPPSRPPEAWESLRGQINTELMADTNIILVKVDDANPDRAALLANAVSDSFRQYHLERNLKNSDEAFRFLQEQKTKQEQELLKAEAELQKFRETSQCVFLDEVEKDNPVTVRYKRLCDELTALQIQRIQLDAQVKVVRRAIESGGKALQAGNEPLFCLPAVRTDAAVTAARTGLADAEKEFATASNTMGPRSYQLQGAQIKLDLARKKLQEALTQLVGSLSPQLDMATAQEEDLKKEYEEQTRLALDMSKQSFTFDRLKNEVMRHRKLFDVLVDNMRTVSLTADYGKTNVEVVEPASVPTEPIRPNKARTTTMAVFLGLLLGVGLAFLLEYMDDTITTPDDLMDRVGIPVLGFVPDVVSRNGSLGPFAYRCQVSLVEPKSSAAEAYRNIRTSLFFSAPPEESKVIVVTSGWPGDGKTTTAANLALVIAQSGKRVLLIDADFRRPMMHKIFGLDRSVGLSTVLVGQSKVEDAVQKMTYEGKTVENLDILTVGPRPTNPAELLDSQAMRRLLEEVRKNYDRVIMDTPPVLYVADSSIVSAISDRVVLVVKSNKNAASLTIKVREHLEAVKARILGGIINDVFVARLGYYYSRYYKYYPYYRYYRNYDRACYPSKEETPEGKKESAT